MKKNISWEEKFQKQKIIGKPNLNKKTKKKFNKNKKNWKKMWK